MEYENNSSMHGEMHMTSRRRTEMSKAEALASAKRDVDVYNAFVRLTDNKDFRTVIIDGYINRKKEELFNEQMVPNYLSPYSIEDLFSKIESIKDLIEYIGDDNVKGEIEIRYGNANATLSRYTD
jgi:hypothetical protein